MAHFAVTQTGFEWGPLTVTRLISDDRFGYVLEVKAGGKSVEIHSTPHGQKLTVQAVPTEQEAGQ